MTANKINRTAIGNIDLLQKRKIGFLASRQIATLSVLPTLDWATEISQREEVAVVSGFHSRMEREALEPMLSRNIIKLQITDNHILSKAQSKSKSF